MKTKSSLLVGIGLVILIGIGAWFFLNRSKPVVEVGPQDVYGFDREKCPGGVREMQMGDVYMRGILEMNETYHATMNWYKCNKPEHGDIVLYRFSNNAMPVVRRIVAVPGDQIEVKYDTKSKVWNFFVNDDMVLSATETPYFFGGSAAPPLKLYEQSHKGKMGDTEVVVFSSFPPGSEDSGTFGAIAIEDIVAKVEKIKR